MPPWTPSMPARVCVASVSPPLTRPPSWVRMPAIVPTASPICGYWAMSSAFAGSATKASRRSATGPTCCLELADARGDAARVRVHAVGDAVEPGGPGIQLGEAAGDAVDALRVLGDAVGVGVGAARGIRGPGRRRRDAARELAEPARERVDARRDLRGAVGGVAEGAADRGEVRVEPLEVLRGELAAERGGHRVADGLRDRAGQVAVRVVGADVEVRLGGRLARERRDRRREVARDGEHRVGVAGLEQLRGLVVVRDGPREPGGLGCGQLGDEQSPREHGLLGAVGQGHRDHLVVVHDDGRDGLDVLGRTGEGAGHEARDRERHGDHGRDEHAVAHAALGGG